MSFQLVTFDSGCKPHFLPSSIAPEIIQDLKERFEFENYTVVSREGEGVVADLGGAVMVNAPMLTMDLDGSKLYVRQAQLDEYYSDLKAAIERSAGGKPYYKIHGRWHCICFTPEQRLQVLEFWGAAVKRLRTQIVVEKIALEGALEDLVEAGVTPAPPKSQAPMAIWGNAQPYFDDELGN